MIYITVYFESVIILPTDISGGTTNISSIPRAAGDVSKAVGKEDRQQRH